MTKRFPYILSSILFILLFALVAGLSIFLMPVKKMQINLIELKGNIYLPKEDYLRYAHLLNKNEYRYLDLKTIKDRIKKHPYIKNAEVRIDGFNKALISISEKPFDAILIDDSKQFLVTEQVELVPLFEGTKYVDFPLVKNPKTSKVFRMMKFYKNNSDLITGLKILAALKLINPSLYQNLSEIDLRKGKDILFYLSDSAYPVLIGRGNEIKKTLCFNSLYPYLTNEESKNIDYVDLRFNNYMYLGINRDSVKSLESSI
ncbi:MAG: FtsQ-type POTRA domain-containing protein [Melioribacteraceae bacterium]|nr:FtsQ-type POTRA domain-containing protein [Melioribacteraceae bacterium]